MIFNLEFDDDDLEYLRSNLRHGTFTLNRWSAEESARCGRLFSLGVIRPLGYHGDAICYNPVYALTELGMRVYDAFTTHPRPVELGESYALETEEPG